MARVSGWQQRLSRGAWMGALATALALATACGGEEDKGNGSPGGGGGGGGNTGGGSQVSNGSRLSWDQSAASTQQVQSMTFRIYVDDAPMSMSAVNCGQSATAGAYDCSGLLPTMTPGGHVLQLTSILSGVESARSESLRITISASTTGDPASSEVSDGDSGSESGSPLSNVCFADPRECFAMYVLARGLREATGLTTLPDGRLLFIENGSRVRVIADDALVDLPALTVPDPDSRLLSLAIDISSSDTTSVFVAWSDVGANGRPLLNVTRYRELAGTLGEGATIITGLPFVQGGFAPMAVDARGLLYLAVPATGADVHGAVLRFTRDGFVPEINWRGLPTISAGYARPTSMAIDVDRNKLWLAGSDTSWSSPVSALTLVYDAAVAEARPEPLQVQELPALEISLALLSSKVASGNSLIVGAGGRLVSGALTTDGTVNVLRPVESTPFVVLGPAANGVRGKWYALSGNQEYGFALVSLSPLTR
jgi:hypothetical protein